MANIATAKNELSRLLRLVGRGERVMITDRNRPVALLQPIGAVEAGESGAVLAALQEAGVLVPPGGAVLDVGVFLSSPCPALGERSGLVAAVLAEREEGR